MPELTDQQKLDLLFTERRNTGTSWTRNEQFDRDGYFIVKDLWEVEGYASWTFDETICDYKPPKEYPSDNKVYQWKESTQEWVQYPEDEKVYEWDKTNEVWKEITE